MSEEHIDKVLRDAGQPPPVDPALLDRVKASLGPAMLPVRPLAPTWLLAAGLVLICAVIGIAGAVALGLKGVHVMSPVEIAAIFPVLAAMLCLSAAYYAGAMIPGSRLSGARWTLPAIVCLVLIAIFALLFHTYQTQNFVRQGLVCLKAGLLHAVPAALACWWLLRRGCAVDSVATGLAQGTLAGLAGVLMLELHCAILEAPHVMLWHVAVVPVSAAGAAIFWMATRARSSL